MNKITLCLLILLLLIPPRLVSTQEQKSTLAFYGLESADLDVQTVATVENLVFAFISDQREYNIIDARFLSKDSGENISLDADYVCAGTIESDGAAFALTLALKKKDAPAEEAKTARGVYENYNRVLLESRSLVRSLLDGSREAAGAAADAAQNEDGFSPIKNLDMLAGSWKSDENIEKIIILRAGRAIAVFANGASMQLNLAISGGALVVTQKSPASAQFFTDLPYAVAQEVSLTAPPMQWELQLARDAKTLVGSKKTISVKHNGESVLQIDSATYDVVWRRE